MNREELLKLYKKRGKAAKNQFLKKSKNSEDAGFDRFDLK